MSKWICEICGDTEMAVLYNTISEKRACNPCTDNENDKWLGDNHFVITTNDLFDQEDLLIP